MSLVSHNRYTMPRVSAGLLMYRRRAGLCEVFLVHPGGPFFAKKDLAAWTVPKGEYDASEEPLEAARREFAEETGFTTQGPYLTLGSVKQAGGKIVAAWAFEGDCDPATLVSSTCEIEWPPKSGRLLQIPEVDRGRWFAIPDARRYIKDTQEPFLDRLCHMLNISA